MRTKRQAQLQKRLVRILALVLALLLVGGAVVSGMMAVLAEEAQSPAQYRVSALQLDSATWQIHCEITYTNATGNALTGVLFSVYANQLRRESALVAESGELSAMYPAGYAPGGVEFSRITVDGEAADWGMQGEQEEFLRVGCALQPGETAVFGFDYALLMIQSRGYIGYSEDDVRLTGFLPAPAVWEGDAFYVNAASAIDRYAYQEAADYVLDVTAEDWYDLAAPGDVTPGAAQNGYRTWRVEAQGVREFALTLSGKYRTECVTSEMGTQIFVKGSDRADLRQAAQAAQSAIDQLEAWLGRAPYDRITIAQADLASAGRSFGGLIWIPADRFARGGRDALEHDVTYFLAQQFFGQAAGNDPVQAPWLSAAVPEFLYYLCIDAWQGRDTMLSKLNADCLPSLLATLPGGYEVDASLTAFSSRADYETIVIHRGAAALYQIREGMGEDAFIAGLANFYRKWNGKIAGLKQFVEAFNEAGGREYDLLIVDWLYTIDDYQGVLIDWFE